MTPERRRRIIAAIDTFLATVRKIGAREAWEEIQRVADEATPAMRRRILNAIAATVEGTDVGALEAALELHDIDAALGAIPVHTLETTLAGGLNGELLTVVQEAAMIARHALPAGLTMAFDLEHPRAQAWAEENGARLVTEVTETTRDGLRALVARAWEEEIPVRDQAKIVRSMVGLLDSQAQAVFRYQEKLQAAGTAAEDVADMVGKYAAKLLRYRSFNIARTETMFAANAGQHELWLQGEEQGVVPGEARRRWSITAGNPKSPVCPICRDLAGQEVGLHDEWETSDGRRLKNPPAHPSCRCAEVLVA